MNSKHLVIFELFFGFVITIWGIENSSNHWEAILGIIGILGTIFLVLLSYILYRKIKFLLLSSGIKYLFIAHLFILGLIITIVLLNLPYISAHFWDGLGS